MENYGEGYLGVSAYAQLTRKRHEEGCKAGKSC